MPATCEKACKGRGALSVWPDVWRVLACGHTSPCAGLTCFSYTHISSECSRRSALSTAAMSLLKTAFSAVTGMLHVEAAYDAPGSSVAIATILVCLLTTKNHVNVDMCSISTMMA